MAVRAGTHAQPAPGRGSLRALVAGGRRRNRTDALEAVLDHLEDEGWLVLPGVETDAGHIEHLAVGPGGVFTLETCADSGRISVETIDERTYDGPYALARRLEDALGRTVTPVLVYRYAKLSRPVSRQRGVMVVMAKTLGEHLLRRRARLTDAEVHGLFHQLVGLGEG